MNDRARVPFALVGVLLLVGSATLSASMAGHAPVTEPRTEAAFEDGRAATLTALRSATRIAARQTARRPVTATANTTVGRVLNGSDPFRAYLTLRVYNRFRDALRSVRGNTDVRIQARIPRVSNATSLRAALDRTTVTRAGNGTLRVRVRNVTLVATRGGSVVDRVCISPTVTVASPVLRFHDRTTRFDSRLDRRPTRRGLARGVTARLYAVAWSRGYAQYAGGPIPNVVANRHVSLAVNHALLAEQRAAFGRSDPSARRAVAVLATQTLGTDVLSASGYTGEQAAFLREQADQATPNATLDPVETFSRSGTPAPESELTVHNHRTATEAFRTVTDGDLEQTLARTYSAQVRVHAITEQVATTRTGTARPGPAWTLVDTHRRTETEVTARPADPPRAPRNEHVLAAFGRRVTQRTWVHRRWRLGDRITSTRSVTSRTVDVDIAVLGQHAPAEGVPNAPIRGVHERGAGPLSGPNLAGIEQRAVKRLVLDRGGPDRLAKRAVAGTLDGGRIRVDGVRPTGLRPWVYRDLLTLRERVANVSVQIERGAIGTYQANPAAELAATLRARRDSLIDAPETYDGVASKARYAARAAYVDAVIARLESKAADRRAVGERLGNRLAAHGTSLSAVRSAMVARQRAVDPTLARDGDSPRTADVDGAPPVLTLSAVRRSRLDVAGDGSYRGLAARNLNVFTDPHGDVTDSVVGALFDARRARLRVAAHTLRAAQRLPPAATTGQVEAQRAELRSVLSTAVERRRTQLRRQLAAAGIGVTPADRRAIVSTALARWETVPSRALALTNGSAADRVAGVAARRHPDAVSGLEQRDQFRLSLRATASDGRGVPESAVNRTATAVQLAGQTVLSESAKEVAARAVNATAERARTKLERRVGRSLARVPAGLPVTPVPNSWYATTNLWIVSARGSYARFSVRANRDTPGRDLRYVRDGSTVRYDWDGDGTREVLGRSERVDLDVRTAIVVVVPPGGQGVGDTDGNADERSAGWNTTPTLSTAP